MIGPAARRLGWVDRGDGPEVHKLIVATVPNPTVDALRDALRLAVNVSSARSFVTVDVVDGKLRLTALPNGSLDDQGKVIPATMELTVNSSNTIVAGGESPSLLTGSLIGGGTKSLKNVETFNASTGANTFLFGNDYWDGGKSKLSTLNNVAQSVPFVDVVARNLQGELTVNTQGMHEANSPLELDFRAVNHELYFTFTPIPGNNDAVMLTVRTERDLKFPIVGTGPIIRNNTIVVTHLDKNTILYGGRYKNTFNIEPGAQYQGHLIGGEGVGLAFEFAGRATDVVRDYAQIMESAALNLPSSSTINTASTSAGYSAPTAAEAACILRRSMISMAAGKSPEAMILATAAPASCKVA